MTPHSKLLPRQLAVEPAFDRQLAREIGISDVDLPATAHRITQGWYAVSAPTNLVERCTAFLHMLPTETVFCDATAASLLGLPIPPRRKTHSELSTRLHINILPSQRQIRRKELIVHRRSLDRLDIVIDRNGLPVVTPERLFIDAASTWGSDYTVALGDAILRLRCSTLSSLRDTATRLRGKRGAAEAYRLLSWLDPRSQSFPESVIRFRLAAAGFCFEPQCAVFNPAGVLLGHADLGDPTLRLAIEYEGRQHSEGHQFDYDIRRYSEFAAAGWWVIRCGRRDLLDGSHRLIAHIKKFCASFTP